MKKEKGGGGIIPSTPFFFRTVRQSLPQLSGGDWGCWANCDEIFLSRWIGTDSLGWMLCQC